MRYDPKTQLLILHAYGTPQLQNLSFFIHGCHTPQLQNIAIPAMAFLLHNFTILPTLHMKFFWIENPTFFFVFCF